VTTNPQHTVKQPVFLVGSERSGTTVLRLMFDHHPDIAWYGEFEYCVDFLPDGGGWPDPASFHRYLAGERAFRATGYPIDPSLDYVGLVSSFLRRKLDQDRKRIIGATVHTHFDRLPRVWPDAKFIHLLRDGRDVASSCIGMGWAGNVWVAVDRWIVAEQLWSRLSRELPPGRSIDVTYESLIREPEAALTRVCEFMGATFSPSMLHYDENTTYSKPDAKLIAQWRRKLTPRELQWAESRIGDMLVERGYELSGHPRITISWCTRCRLRWQDRVWRKLFRLKRYGWWLEFSHLLARRLRIESWREKVQRRIDDINMGYLK
jgi:hypothetical protein